GEVRSVRLDDDTGEVHAEILVERPHILKRNEEPRVGHGLLGGDTVIDFVPKREAAEDRTPVPPGAELRGVPMPDAMTLLNQTSEDKVVKAIDNINDTVTRVGRVFNDENQRLVNATLKNVRSGTENFESLSKSTEQTIHHLDQATLELNRVLAETHDVLRVLN